MTTNELREKRMREWHRKTNSGDRNPVLMPADLREFQNIWRITVQKSDTSTVLYHKGYKYPELYDTEDIQTYLAFKHWKRGEGRIAL